MLQNSHPKHKQGVFPVFILCLAAVTIANKHSGNYTCSSNDDISITSWKPDTNDDTSDDDTKENSTTDKEGFMRIRPNVRSNKTGEITSDGTTGSSTASTTAPMTSEELLAEEKRTISRLRHRLLRFKSAVTASSPEGSLPHGFDPYVGQFVPCTRDERVCLRFGTLFDPRRGRCLLRVEEWCHAVPPYRRPDLADGRAPLVATCPPGCASPSSPNASSSSSSAGSAGSAQCATATWAGRALACSCRGELAAPRPLTVGGFTCVCEKGERVVEQPSKGHRCRVPQLHLPWTEGSPLDPRRLNALLRSPLPLSCDRRQQLCALNHTVWASESLGCQPLLQRRSSACPEGQWLALNASAALEGTLRAHCVPHDGGCEAEAKGKGRWRRALFDGRCHRLRALRLLGPSPPRPTLFGEYLAPQAPLQLWLRARHNDSEAACELRHALPEQAPPATPAQPPELNATAAALKYRRFHASDSFIGAPIACTYEQKVCFRYNTLFNPSTGRCLPIRGYPEAPPQVDAHELLHGSGQLVAKDVLEPDPCIGYRMAYDGRCYPKALVHVVLCGCAEEPTPHFLGGVECRCGAATPAVRVSQPPGDGHCRIPDLRFPDHGRTFLFVGSPPQMFSAECSRKQHYCFREGKVWFSDPDGCYTLNERGPCPPDHTLVLTNWRASAECVRACPSGQERMAFDDQCHERREIQVLLPPDAKISELNVRGQRLVDPVGYEAKRARLSVDGDFCVVEHIRSTALQEPWAQFAAPLCGAGDGDACLLYEVHSRPPTVDDFEDY